MCGDVKSDSKHILRICLLSGNKKKAFFYPSANNKIVALKEIRLQEEEGAPFTAIREGTKVFNTFPAIVFIILFSIQSVPLQGRVCFLPWVTQELSCIQHSLTLRG